MKNLALDTGAFKTMVRSTLSEDELPAERCFGMPVLNTSKFVLNGTDFGSRNLYFLDITPTLDDMDGYLGMDFLKEHAIFLDFERKMAHICKSCDALSISETND